MTSKGPVDVSGVVRGTVSAPGILIAASATVDGDLVALSVVVQGTVQGHVEAKSVDFAATAVVHADVALERIAVANGARIEGRFTRLD